MAMMRTGFSDYVEIKQGRRTIRVNPVTLDVVGEVPATETYAERLRRIVAEGERPAPQSASPPAVVLPAPDSILVGLIPFNSRSSVKTAALHGDMPDAGENVYWTFEKGCWIAGLTTAPLVVNHDESAIVATSGRMEIWQAADALHFRAQVNRQYLANALGYNYALLKVGAIAVSPRFAAADSYFERPPGFTPIQHITSAMLGHIGICADGGAIPGAGCWFER